MAVTRQLFELQELDNDIEHTRQTLDLKKHALGIVMPWIEPPPCWPPNKRRWKTLNACAAMLKARLPALPLKSTMPTSSFTAARYPTPKSLPTCSWKSKVLPARKTR